MSFFLFPWTARSFPFFPVPRAHFVRVRVAITSIMGRFQLSDATNAVQTSTLSLPPLTVMCHILILLVGTQAQLLRWIWRNRAPVCVNWPQLSVSSGQKTFLVTAIFMFPSRFPTATCRWEAGVERSPCGTCSGRGVCGDAGQTKNPTADSSL